MKREVEIEMEMALSLNAGRPMAEGIPGGTSSKPDTSQDSRAYIKFKRSTCYFLYRLFFYISICFTLGFFVGPNRF